MDKRIETFIKNTIKFGLFIGLLLIPFADLNAANGKNYLISAYYSPLPNQQNYLTGNYNSEIRLNGRGTNGADGTRVYLGMIAAPKNIPFGTKLKINGLGVGTVHDRGGAIKVNGERGYDRLDVWMGYGDEGLKRAVSWGKKVVYVENLGRNSSIRDNINLGNVKMASRFSFPKNTNKKTLVASKKPVKVVNNKVIEMKTLLKELGLYTGQINDSFNNEAEKSVKIFYRTIKGLQKNSINSFSETYLRDIKNFHRVRNNEVIKEIPIYPLQLGDKSEKVKKLQASLVALGFDIPQTGYFGQKTFIAVREFQLNTNIIFTLSDYDAGYFGKQTHAKLKKYMFPMRNRLSLFKESTINHYNLYRKPKTVFTKTLSLGTNDVEVRRLQEELVRLNFLAVKPTGIYGNITKHAVFKFQQKMDIVSSKYHQGAGVFGPSTRAKMEGLITKRQNFNDKLIAKRDFDYKANDKNTFLAKMDLGKFLKSLRPGDANDEVKNLQIALKELGYFKGKHITEFYGNVTKDALIAFQMDHNIIRSSSNNNAGVFNDMTKSKLNSLIN